MKKPLLKLPYLRQTQKCEVKKSKLLLIMAMREVSLMVKRWRAKRMRMTCREKISTHRLHDSPILSEIQRSQRLPLPSAHN